MLLLALAPLVYFFPAVRGSIVLCPADGITQNLPLRVAAFRVIAEGHLPLWNPFYFSGMPLLAAAQAGILFPLNWFFLVFPAPVAMNLAVLSTYTVAGTGAYLYARRAGANIAGALTTALVWQWGGFLVAQLGHMNIIQTACLLPWLLWAIDRFAATRKAAWGGSVALIVALAAFAGHQQTFAYSLLLASLYALFMAARGPEQERRPYLWSLALLLLGASLAAVQILPTLELLRNSMRAQATYEFFTSFSMPPVFFLTYFAPYIVGGGDGSLFRAPYVEDAFYAEYIGYVGLPALALAVVALLIRRDELTKFWALTAVIAFALALGRFWPFDLYRLIYHVPLLNLFRVPARHLMEVDFALAVLAGRGVTAIAERRVRKRTRLITLSVALVIFAIVCLTVTALRPEAFHAGRPVQKLTLLRAPELFLPPLLAALSAWALWRLARGRRGAVICLVVLVVFDLSLWGQMSGWRQSPRRDEPFWRTPDAVKALAEREGDADGRYRILTFRFPFNTNAAASEADGKEPPFVWAVQPDAYMIYGIENAAGYDGFGLARYSRLAGDMKVWGDLADPAEALGESRAFDLLNVRYLVAPSPNAGRQEERQTTQATPTATEKFGGYLFAAEELGVPYLDKGARLGFVVPRTEANRVALVTSLAWSTNISDGVVVGRVRLRSEDGREFEFPLRAGHDSSEWAYEREAREHTIRHGRAPVATSYEVTDPKGNFQGHSYVTSFALPERVSITGGTIEVATEAREPQLGLTVQRLSLIDEQTGAVLPLRKNWFTKALAPGAEKGEGQMAGGERWRRVAEFADSWLYENTRALPRAWLATEASRMTEEQMLETVRTGRLADGNAWEPRRTVLHDAPLGDRLDEALAQKKGATNETGGAAAPAGDAAADTRAEITRYEPNRIEVRASTPATAILVLAENHYPGWRAYLDGRAVETLRVNYNLRGVVVPAGTHQVSFAYRPKSALFGLLISTITAALLLLWALRERMRRTPIDGGGEEKIETGGQEKIERGGQENEA